MFYFGAASQQRLAGVVPALVAVADHAIQISAQDFCVGEGVRSAADQLRDWYRRTSKLNGIPVGATVNGVRGTGVGNHQVKADGFGHALDLVPVVGGALLWTLPAAEQWPHIYPVADAMRTAAISLGTRIRWGGVWDRILNDLAPGAAALEQAVRDYEGRHAGPDFIDGPHFEILP
jgi:peptidoglycan L-alanyl-D-glutamate endopeptidase CwlK